MQETPFEKDYSAVAAEYERTRYGTAPGQFVSRCETRLLRRAIIAHAKRRHILLDVACGTGYFTSQVADLFERVVGVDLTHAMLARAAINLSRVERGRVSLVQASAAALPLVDGSCDVVLSTRFLHLFPREMHSEILEVLLRPLRQGGVLIVDHDTRFVEWRGRQHNHQGSRHSYHSGDTPAAARRVAQLGVSGPRLPTVARIWPIAATWLTSCFVRSPLNRLSTILIVVYLKR
jgi:ubiquinone/menaquinone biosynthesis C-methylase UbiE